MTAIGSGAGTGGAAAAAAQTGAAAAYDPVARVLKDPDYLYLLRGKLDQKNLGAFAGMSPDAADVVFYNRTIKVTSENINDIFARVGDYYLHADDLSRVKEIPNTPSVIDQREIKLNLSSLSEAELVRMASLFQDYPDFARKVSKLRFSCSPALTDQMLEGMLKNTPNLEVLNLRETNISALPAIELPHLRELILSGNEAFTDDALADVLNHTPNLEVLHLRETKITKLPDGIKLPNLRELILSGNEVFTDDALADILQHNRQIEVLGLRETKITKLPDGIKLPNLRKLNL